jgi:hypothetical protein
MDPSTQPPTYQPPPQTLPTPTVVPISPKHKLFPKVLIVLLILVVLFSTSIGYLFWYTPRVQAKEYLVSTSSDFFTIQQKLSSFQDSFNPLSQSYNKSKTAFYEITESRSYSDAQTDTQQDIKDITDTLDLIRQAKETKSNLSVPHELEQLDQLLDEYYDSAEKSLISLKAYEEFQIGLLTASGDKFNTEVGKFIPVMQNAQSRQEQITYLNNLTQVANQSADNIKKLVPPDDNQKTYQNLFFEYTYDTATTSAAVASLIAVGDTASDTLATQHIIDLSGRNIIRNNQVKQNSQDYVTNSPIKKQFEANTATEISINDLFKSLKEKYSLNQTQDATLTNPSSPTPQPIITPDTTSTLSSQPIPTIP